MPIYVNGELVLYGFVGDSFWNDGFTSLEVLQALATHGPENDLTVRLNSGGGGAFEGMAIYNALNAHKGKVTIKVDAIAASAASIIALAGDDIVMRAGSEMMIHDPSGGTFGTAAEHEKTAASLNKLAEQMVSLYAARSGKDAEEVREIMLEETWLTAEEAVEAGFATEAEEAKAKQVTAFDYRIYAHAPARLTALSEKKGWSFDRPVNLIAASPASTSQEETTEMADNPTAAEATVDAAKITADVEAATMARIDGILASKEAEGREAQARHFAFKTKLSVEDAVAALALAPIAAPAAATDPAPSAPEAAAEASYEASRTRASGQAAPDAQNAQNAGAADWSAAIKRAGKSRNGGS